MVAIQLRYGNADYGTVTAKAVGALTVQAAYVEVTPAGSSPSAATASPQNLSASAQITITAAGTSNVPTITWNAPAAISYGTALGSTQLNATANVPGTFAYTPRRGPCSKREQQTLSATFTPTDTKTYSAATASVQLTVNQATPVIYLGYARPSIAARNRPQRDTIGCHRKCARQLHVQPCGWAPFFLPAHNN